MSSSECSQDKSCINQLCKDPCPGTCGVNAQCRVVNHNPICTCVDGFTGDPFRRCIYEESKLYLTCMPVVLFHLLSFLFSFSFFLCLVLNQFLYMEYIWYKCVCAWYLECYPTITTSSNPCVPSPCGVNSQCHLSNDNRQAICACLPNYIGRAPNCRPECTLNSECLGNMACINYRCQDPCIGTCGSFTTCIVNNHRPVCRCIERYTGDPFSVCSPISMNRFINLINLRSLKTAFN